MANLSNQEIVEFNKFLGISMQVANECNSLKKENKELKEQLRLEREENNKLREQYNSLVEKIAGRI